MRPVYRLALMLTLAGGCGTSTPDEPPTPKPTTPAPSTAAPPLAQQPSCPSVQVFGSMQRFREGDLSQTVALADLDWSETTIALGATAGKTAEITAVDGQLWVVAPAAQGVDVQHDPQSQGGSLLAVATPATWDEGRPIGATDGTSILAEVASERAGTPCAGADAVPFIVRGRAEELTWSIVGQPSGKQGSEKDVDVVIVGLWAPAARGEYVPPSLDGHLHVVAPSANVAGHLVSVRLAGGATLHLPTGAP